MCSSNVDERDLCCCCEGVVRIVSAWIVWLSVHYMKKLSRFSPFIRYVDILGLQASTWPSIRCWQEHNQQSKAPYLSPLSRIITVIGGRRIHAHLSRWRLIRFSALNSFTVIFSTVPSSRREFALSGTKGEDVMSAAVPLAKVGGPSSCSST